MDITPDRLAPHNLARRNEGMPYAYADGFGTWHAVIPAHAAEPEKVARRIIRDELDMRGELGKGYRVRVKRESGRDFRGDSLRFVEA